MTHYPSIMTNTVASIAWLTLAIIALLAITFVVILPSYTILLAVITILRSKWSSRSLDGHGNRTALSSPWSRINTSFFQGKVFHIRHQPMIHSFKYPLYFSVVDLDEASELFGGENVQSSQEPEPQQSVLNPKGSLWPLSSLMLLRDVDHLKNGEGMNGTDPKDIQNTSLRERISNLLNERTNGKLDLQHDASAKRKILLVTHLMYYGYCFNPVSFFIILKPNNSNKEDEGEEDEIEAIVLEVSNTPWNEMSIYVLHPDSVDTVEYSVSPPSKNSDVKSKKYQYRLHKNFHVSPFMTMDHDYDWRFQVSRDKIKAEVRLIKQNNEDAFSSSEATIKTANTNGGDKESSSGQLYFTGGFDIQRTIQPTSTYPLQLAKVIYRFPIYCFVIQVWIHYEAVRLLIKGVEFIPHPDGSETGASKAIAAVVRPVFAVIDAVDVWWKNRRGKSKSA